MYDVSYPDIDIDNKLYEQIYDRYEAIIIKLIFSNLTCGIC
jgi:hypothetical protein